MQQIYRICHETVFPLIGRTRYYGTVSKVSNGRVLLTDCTIGDGALTVLRFVYVVDEAHSSSYIIGILSSY